jgi:hypothetical protein
MIVRLAVIGAGLIVIGLLHFGSSGTPAMVGGIVLLTVAGIVWIVQRTGGLPAGKGGTR